MTVLHLSIPIKDAKIIKSIRIKLFIATIYNLVNHEGNNGDNNYY